MPRKEKKKSESAVYLIPRRQDEQIIGIRVPEDMLRKRRSIGFRIFGTCCIVVASVLVIGFILISFDLIPSVIYPTKSSPHKLSIVRYSGFYPNKPVITLRHYEKGIRTGIDVLVIKNGVYIQEPQSYELPDFDNGTVEVDVDWGDKINDSFMLTYERADDLYREGLLIYLAKYDDSYVCFVSGRKTTCYSKADESEEWRIETEIPSLKAIPCKENPGFVAIYSGWKENKWVADDDAG